MLLPPACQVQLEDVLALVAWEGESCAYVECHFTVLPERPSTVVHSLPVAPWLPQRLL